MPTVSRLVSLVPVSAMAFYAHPDDADVSCGATLALWAQHGVRVDLIVCTKGEKGTIDPAKDTTQLQNERRLEVENAGAIIGLTSITHLDIPDGEIENSTEFRSHIVHLIRKFRPEVVLSPDPTAIFFGTGYFNHRDHRELGWAVLDSLSPAAGLPHYFPTTGSAHQVSTVLLSGSLEPDVLIDVSDSIGKKLDAIACHKSQIGDRENWMRNAISSRAKEAARSVGIAYAEGFRMLELGG